MIVTLLRRIKTLGTIPVKSAKLPRVFPTFLRTVTETSNSPSVSSIKISLELLDGPDILLSNPDRQEVLETRNTQDAYRGKYPWEVPFSKSESVGSTFEVLSRKDAQLAQEFLGTQAGPQ